MRHATVSSCLRIVFLGTAFAASAAAGVHVIDVNNGPGTDFSHPNLALPFVAAGDVLLVRAGGYAFVEWSGTPVTFVAEAGATVRFASARVSNLPAGTDTVFRGIDFEAAVSDCGAMATVTAVTLESNAGAVMIEDASLTAGRPSVRVTDCASVTLSRCAIVGSGYWYTCLAQGPNDPSSGVIATNSVVRIQDCAISGGHGAHAGYSTTGQPAGAHHGASALRVAGGEAFVSGSQLQGGNGGNGMIDGLSPPPFQCVPGGPGGAGLQLTAAGGLAHLLDTVVTAGTDGTTPATCTRKPPGQPIVQAGGTVITIPGATNSVVAPAPAREGEATQLTITAPAGHVIVVFISSDFSADFLPAFQSVLHAGLPASVFSLGAMPHMGPLTIPVVIPALLPPGASARAFVQVANCDAATGACRFGSPSTAVILDASL